MRGSWAAPRVRHIGHGSRYTQLSRWIRACRGWLFSVIEVRRSLDALRSSSEGLVGESTGFRRTSLNRSGRAPRLSVFGVPTRHRKRETSVWLGIEKQSALLQPRSKAECGNEMLQEHATARNRSSICGGLPWPSGTSRSTSSKINSVRSEKCVVASD